MYVDILDTKIANIEDLTKRYGDEYDKNNVYYGKAIYLRSKVERIVSLKGGYYSNHEESDNFSEEEDNSFEKANPNLRSNPEIKKKSEKHTSSYWIKKGTTLRTNNTTVSEAERIGNYIFIMINEYIKCLFDFN